jgi:tetratricopeptide (TPR) repeat protein
MARAGIELEKGAATRAIADLRAVLRDAPASAQAMRLLARAYEVNHDVGLAEETLRGAIRTNPNDVQTRLALAQLLVRIGRGDEAQPVADQAVKDRPSDIRSLQAAFYVQVARRDLTGASSSAASIVALRPDLPDGYYLKGLVDETEGKHADALAAFEKASAMAPTAIDPVAAAVRIDFAQHQGERALSRVGEALAKAPKNAALLDLKGLVMLQLKRNDEAAAVLGEAVAAGPGWWVAQRDLALAEIARGRNEAAIEAYQRGIESTGYSPELLTQLGGLFERLGRTNDGIALYEGWLKRDPESEVAANNYAMLLVNYRARNQGSLQQAAALTERFRKSSQPQYLDTYGWVRLLNGDIATALPALERAASALPGDPQVRAHLGLAQYRAGRPDAARRNLEDVANHMTGLPESDAVRAALQVLRSSKAP